MLDRADKRMDNRKLCYENIGGMGARSKTDAEMNIDFPFFFGEIAALKVSLESDGFMDCWIHESILFSVTPKIDQSFFHISINPSVHRSH